jgi:hypothetical protein
MTIRNNAQKILDYVNTAVRGDGLTFNEDGVAAFAVDENIICFFSVVEDQAALVVTIYLGRVQESDAALMYEMLCGNYMGAYTGGGTLGIDAEEGLVALHTYYPLPVDDPAWIEEPLAGLIGAARYWRDKLSASISGTSTSDPQESLLRV